MDYSFREARGSIALVTSELGVHLPRELTMLLAHIPAIGAAFEVMLPLAGVFAALGVIGELMLKNTKNWRLPKNTGSGDAAGSQTLSLSSKMI